MAYTIREVDKIDSYANDPVWVKVQNYLPESNQLSNHNLPDEYFISVGNLDIHIDHYRIAAPKGRIIIFHGVGGNGRLLSFIAIPLKQAGFEVICPDLPLYGCTHYSERISYSTWSACGADLVKHYKTIDTLPTFLFGLSAGGMLAYQIACECHFINGLIVTCLLDQREKAVVRNTAQNPFLGRCAKPFLSLVTGFAGDLKIPMKWVSNMKAIANNRELVSLLVKDRKSSGAKVPLHFIYSMLNPYIKIEPENFKVCPVLLVHPGNDHWTNIELSELFYKKLACNKKTVILEGAGHFPIESEGLKQMENACISFMEENIKINRRF